MTQAWPIALGPKTPPEQAGLGQVRALLAGLYRVLRLAHALLDSGRAIDLTGLETAIGLLCAKALDLPPDQGRAVAPELSAVRDEIARLLGRLREAWQVPDS